MYNFLAYFSPRGIDKRDRMCYTIFITINYQYMGETSGYNPGDEKSGITFTPEEWAKREAMQAQGGNPEEDRKAAESPGAVTFGDDQKDDEKSLEEKVEEIKQIARDRAKEIEGKKRQILELVGKFLFDGEPLPDDLKRFFLDGLCPQLEVMCSGNGVFLVRNDGYFFDKTRDVADKWLKRLEGAVSVAQSADAGKWGEQLARMRNAIRSSHMLDDQFWLFPANGVIDSFGAPTFERVAGEPHLKGSK